MTNITVSSVGIHEVAVRAGAGVHTGEDSVAFAGDTGVRIVCCGAELASDVAVWNRIAVASQDVCSVARLA